MAPNSGSKSPFFAPSTPRKVVQVSTPGGTAKFVKKESTDAKEHKSGVNGATSNLINAIIGAGIVGIPFAIKETGLVAGVLLIILCAILTEKSLRVLIDTAKHVDVPSYEMLFESTYGSFGFYFISINMLIMAYGGCLSYLCLIKDTLPVLLGVGKDDPGMERAILTVSTMLVILPISMQRDMADLAKTSQVSVLFQCAMVLIVVVFSPVSESVAANGGLRKIASESIVKTSTLFIGLGVLSFAFVCQHSAFIVAGSLERPTKKRWATATSRALALCVILEAGCGVAGYLAFLEKTDGDILNNFLDLGGGSVRAANIARGLLCTTMFFVYPMDSFVCRHVLVVLFFRGRRAHEGDDAAVLSRRDRRVAITMAVYLLTLIPALMVENVGSVLAVTGTIGASCLAYIGPGLIYMAVYGREFLEKVEEVWPTIKREKQPTSGHDVESSRLLANTTSKEAPAESESPPSTMQNFVWDTAWYVLGLPIWTFVAKMGQRQLAEFKEKEALKSPHINRLGKVAPVQINQVELPTQPTHRPRVSSFGDPADVLRQPLSPPGPKMLPYGAITGGNKAIGAAILAKKRSDGNLKAQGQGEDATDLDVLPTWFDFCYAIFFIGFGFVALFAGLFSIIMGDSKSDLIAEPNAAA